MKLTQAQLEAKAKTRWQIATVAFADGDGTDGWTQLLAMGMDLAAITGEPLKYRRADGGGFVLYSVGLNKTDDGGKRCERLRDWQGLLYPKPDFSQNDWVWTCPGENAAD